MLRPQKVAKRPLRVRERDVAFGLRERLTDRWSDSHILHNHNRTDHELLTTSLTRKTVWECLPREMDEPIKWYCRWCYRWQKTVTAGS